MDPHSGTIAGRYGGSINQASAIETSSPLRDAIGQTEAQVEQLHTVITELEQRLDTVLLPVGPSTIDKASPSPPMPAMSHVRERVGKMNGGFLHAIDRLNELRRRVDL